MQAADKKCNNIKVAMILSAKLNFQTYDSRAKDQLFTACSS